ncbi:MAG: nuclear transport factor 2 family protein [Candidatus Binatia bacterium]
MLIHRRPLQPTEIIATAPIAERWLEAWNGHDLNRILALYTTDARHTSKRVRALGGENDTLQGKQAIAEYFRRGLERYPSLHFEPISVSTGPRTVAIEYSSQRTGSSEPTLELLELNGDGLIAHSRVYHGP